jgi:tRNA pseudouridine55 synthase
MSLRRLSTGPFDEAQMVNMETIENLSKEADEGDAALDQLLVPMDSALEHINKINLTEEMTYYLCLGQAVSVPRAPTEGLVRIYDHNRAFVGIGTILDDGRVAPKRLLKTYN